MWVVQCWSSDFGGWKNIGECFETYKECIEYIDKHHGINLSISGEYNECTNS